MGKETKETAEQKLLKLIETSGTPEGTPPQTKGEDVAKQAAEAVRGTGMPKIGVPSFLKGALGARGASTGGPALGLRETNTILLAGILAASMFFAFDFLNGMKILQKNIDFSINPNIGDNAAILLPQFKNLSVYLATIDTRNIFLPFEKKAQEETAAPVVETKKIDTMAAKLKLVGVSWLDSAESASVMIEDTENGMTFFAGQGEKIKEMTIKEIFTDRVILTYEDEEITIKL